MIHLVSGGELVVARWWQDGDTIYYETDAGVVGIPVDDVARIEPHEGTRTPSMRARVREEASEPAPSGPVPAVSVRVPEGFSDPERVEEAIARLESELRREADRARRDDLARRLADLWVVRARLHRAAGEREHAIDAYRRALDHAPGHRVARVEAGWLELAEGRLEWARAHVETGLAHAPGDPWLLELQAELFYRDERLTDAVEALEGALAGRPADARLAARLDKLRRELAVEREYRRADSSNFTLLFDGDRDEEIGAMLLDTLENARAELAAELDVAATLPTSVILYTREAFHDTTGTPREVAGLFDGKIRLPVGGLTRVTPAVERVVRHEVTHALLHVKGRGRVPRWLHEGLAQRLEPRSPDTVRAALARRLRDDPDLGLEPFAYATALSFTGFLDAEYGRARLLWMVDLLAEGRGEEEAFLEAFGIERDRALETWRQRLTDRP